MNAPIGRYKIAGLPDRFLVLRPVRNSNHGHPWGLDLETQGAGVAHTASLTLPQLVDLQERITRFLAGGNDPYTYLASDVDWERYAMTASGGYVEAPYWNASLVRQEALRAG